MQVLIVDDHPLFLEAISAAVSAAIEGVRTITAASLGEAKQRLEECSGVSLILLDLALPDTNGFEGLIALRQRCPQLPILVVSAFAEARVIERARVCGATGFVAKASAKSCLIDAVRGLLLGKVVVAPDAAARLDEAGEGEAMLGVRIRSLTRQQLRVLEMLCQGLLNKQIAHVLQVSETTVKAHVSEILRKLNVSSRTQAVVEVSKLDFGRAAVLYEDAYGV